MCGICGLAYRDPRRQPVVGTLRRMADTIRHRGPDDEGIEVLGQVGLAHRRLSIIDLSDAGHQPMCNEDGTVWIAYNGEVYNFEDLRKQLVGKHDFRSHTDTEVLLHLYEERGPEMVDLLDGMFALAIYDARQRKLFLARDPFGIKPLFYSFDETRFVFGSEIKPLLASGEVSREIDRGALNDFFNFIWIPGPRSIFKQVRKLPPAHFMVLDLERWDLQIQRYWQPQYRPEEGKTAQAWSEEIEQQLSASVESQLVSDVPLGTFLSGGIDSTLVTHYASQALSSRLKTFTIDFQEQEQSEGESARQVTEKLGTDAVFRTLEQDSLASLAPMAEFFDEPFADASLLPTSRVSREARREVTVILSGDGGDELFTGYPHHAKAAWMQKMDHLPSSFSQLAFGLLARMTPANLRVHPWAHRFSMLPTQRRMSLLRLPGQSLRRSVLSTEWQEPLEAQFRVIEDYLGELQGLPPITQVQFYDLLMYLPNDMLVKVDRASMASSLETRVPFLSRSLADLAFRIPEEIRFHPEVQKPLLRRLVARHFDRQLAYRKKQGFAIPMKQWMTEAASDDTEHRILEGPSVRDGCLDATGVKRLFAAVRSGGGKIYVDRTDELFALLCFDSWWKRYML